MMSEKTLIWTFGLVVALILFVPELSEKNSEVFAQIYKLNSDKRPDISKLKFVKEEPLKQFMFARYLVFGFWRDWALPETGEWVAVTFHLYEHDAPIYYMWRTLKPNGSFDSFSAFADGKIYSPSHKPIFSLDIRTPRVFVRVRSKENGNIKEDEREFPLTRVEERFEN